MSDLQPTGILVNLDGVERHFLFTLNVIDEIQSKYDSAVLDAMSKMFPDNGKEPVSDILFFVTTLINDEVDREAWRNPDFPLKKVTEKEAGWMVTWDNLNEVRTAILKAYHISMPESDEEENPNPKSGRRKK